MQPVIDESIGESFLQPNGKSLVLVFRIDFPPQVNVACFNPVVGGGFVYGTKEGRVRVLEHCWGGMWRFEDEESNAGV